MTLSVGRWVAITVLAAMTLAACGGDPGPRNAAPSGSVPALADGTIPWVNEPARDEDFQVGAPRRRKAGPQARSCRAGQLVAVLPEWLPKGDTDDGTPRSAARGLIGLVRVTNTGEQECSLQGEVPTTLFTGGRPAQVRSTHSVNDEARARVTAIAPDEVATLRLDWSARTAVRR